MHNSIFNGWNIIKWIFNIFILIVTVYILSVFINITFAAGYIVMLGMHELGHVMAAKGYGATVRFGGFTPFGAYIQIVNETSVKENAVIAVSGPLCGFITTILYYFLFYLLKDQTFLWLSFFTGMVSLLNLLPLNPFDGGKVISGTFVYFPLFFVPLLLYGAYRSYRDLPLLAGGFGLLVVYVMIDVLRMRRENRIEMLFRFDRSEKLWIFFAYVVIVFALSALLAAMVFDYKDSLLPQIQPLYIPEEFIPDIIRDWLP